MQVAIEPIGGLFRGRIGRRRIGLCRQRNEKHGNEYFFQLGSMLHDRSNGLHAEFFLQKLHPRNPDLSRCGARRVIPKFSPFAPQSRSSHP